MSSMCWTAAKKKINKHHPAGASGGVIIIHENPEQTPQYLPIDNPEKHTAYSKAIFGKGAVQAAKFLKGKAAGMYGMKDVI